MAGMEESLSWGQDDAEVVATFAVAGGTATRDVVCKIAPTTLRVSVGERLLFDDTFCAKCDVDESFWALEGSGEGRRLVVTITKLKAGRQWPFLGKEMQRALAESGDGGGATSGGGGGGGGGDTADRRAASGSGSGELLSLGTFMDDEDVEDAELQQAQEVKLEARFNALRDEKGLEAEETLRAFFDFFEIAIQLYHLNKLSGYLKQVVPVCRQRDDSFKLKGIQALAFVLWKQQHLTDAVKLFHEMEELMGKNAALCENIAHTYNSLGDYPKAEDYFRQALQLIEAGCTSGSTDGQGGNRGGVLLGLGLVRDRLDHPEEALPILEQAYQFYKQRAGGQLSSLCGKAGVSCGMVHLRLGDEKQAEKYIREAIHIYEVTCGATSPLTGGAYFKLGQILWDGSPKASRTGSDRPRRKEARRALKRAYEIEAGKDAFTIIGVLEIHNMVMDTFLKDSGPAIDRAGFAAFLPVVSTAERRVQAECIQDGNAAVYYKAAAELRAWGGSYAEAIPSFERAIKLFKAESTHDCSKFIEECKALLDFAHRNLDGTQASPMVLDTHDLGDDETAATTTAEQQQQPEVDAPAVDVQAPASTRPDAEQNRGDRQEHVRAVDSAYLSVDEPDDVL